MDLVDGWRYAGGAITKLPNLRRFLGAIRAVSVAVLENLIADRALPHQLRCQFAAFRRDSAHEENS